MNAKLPLDREKIAAFCQRWQIIELSLFGSALRDDFGPNSDVDVLVTFSPAAKWGLFDLIQMQDELKEIFQREIDLAERKSVEQSENYIRRRHILSDLESIYVAG